MNLTFTVLFMNDAQMAGTGAVGFCDPETQTIGLVGSQPDDSMQDTFLHEVFHSIVHVMDLKETETEENYVRRDFINNGNPQADLRLPDNYSSVSFALHTFLLNLFKKKRRPGRLRSLVIRDTNLP